MFATTLAGCEGETRVVIGQFDRIDAPHIVLKADNSEVRVEHRGMEQYKTKNIMVSGTIRDQALVEDRVYAVEDDFDYSEYSRLAALSGKYPGVF